MISNMGLEFSPHSQPEGECAVHREVIDMTDRIFSRCLDGRERSDDVLLTLGEEYTKMMMGWGFTRDKILAVADHLERTVHSSQMAIIALVARSIRDGAASFVLHKPKEKFVSPHEQMLAMARQWLERVPYDVTGSQYERMIAPIADALLHDYAPRMQPYDLHQIGQEVVIRAFRTALYIRALIFRHLLQKSIEW